MRSWLNRQLSARSCRIRSPDCPSRVLMSARRSAKRVPASSTHCWSQFSSIHSKTNVRFRRIPNRADFARFECRLERSRGGAPGRQSFRPSARARHARVAWARRGQGRCSPAEPKPVQVPVKESRRRAPVTQRGQFGREAQDPGEVDRRAFPPACTLVDLTCRRRAWSTHVR